MTNLDHLNVIRTICDMGSFQLASEKLNKARSAVSYSVKQVEETYQIQIFDRSNYRPRLTAEGQALLGRIRHLLRQAQEFEAFVEGLKGNAEMEIRLGVSNVFPASSLTNLLSAMREQFPTTTIHLEFEVASGDRMLLANQVDLAIFAAPTHNNELDYRHISQMDLPLVVSRDLFADLSGDVTRDNLGHHPQVVVKSSDDKSPDTGLLDEAQKWYVTDLSAKKSLICAGLGWGRLPRHLIEEEIASEELAVLTTLGEMKVPICVVKRADQILGPVGSLVWDFFDTEKG